jgi:hypothetical protein
MAMRIIFRSLWVLAAVGLGLFVAREPWRIHEQQEAKRDKALAELRKTQQAKAELLTDKARYGNSVGREELARERGYMRPNEKPLEPGN